MLLKDILKHWKIRFTNIWQLFWKKVYFDFLNGNVDKYNNTYHRTITADVKSDSFAKYNVDSNDKDRKFEMGDHVRISKYKTIFAKGYAPNWSAEIHFYRLMLLVI